MSEEQGFKVRLPLILRKFIKHEKNTKDFLDNGFKLIDTEEGILKIISTKEGSNLEKAEELLDSIVKNYNDIITDSVEVPKDVVAFFRGSKSHHLDKCKEKSLIQNVYFNKIDNSDMVKCLITGERDTVNRFMREILKSWSILSQKRSTK